MLSRTVGGSVTDAYHWHPYYIDALGVRMTASDTHFFLQDANYNVTAVITAGGTVLERYSYTPYGQVTFLEPDFSVKTVQASTIGNGHLYTGRERDPETRLQLNRWRFYAAHLGRWLTRDPIEDGLNLYEYALNRPVTLVDPSGLVACSLALVRRGPWSIPTASGGGISIGVGTNPGPIRGPTPRVVKILSRSPTHGDDRSCDRRRRTDFGRDYRLQAPPSWERRSLLVFAAHESVPGVAANG